MQKQIQSKRSNRPNTVSFAEEIKAKENDDVPEEEIDADQLSLAYLRSFFRQQCEEEMAKIGSLGVIFPPRRGARISADSGAAAVEETRSSSVRAIRKAAEEERDVVVVVTYSRSPYEDFRRSMMKIMAARVERGDEVDREFMEELLLRYLEINNEKFYTYIVQAFLELIGVRHEDSSERTPPRRRRWSSGFRRRKLKLEFRNMHKFCCKRN